MILKDLKLFVFAALIAITACSKDKDEKKEPPKLAQEFAGLAPLAQINALKIIKVADQKGQAIVGAEVLIGNSLDQPFAGNFVKTDSTGSFSAPALWTTPLTVTIQAPGFLRASFLAQSAEAQTYTLRPADSKKNYDLSGQTSGFKIKDKDGIVDFGFVIAGLKKQDLFTLDISKVISADMDQISILGKTLDIPSNVTLPKQKETYILPITLEKPKYRLSFHQPGPTQIYAARGQFPLKPVVDELQAGKEFYELINYFSIQAGALKTIDLNAEKTTGDIAIDEIAFTESRSLRAPLTAGDEFSLSAAVSENLGVMYPTDFKSTTGGQLTKLSLPAASSSYLLTILKKKNELRAMNKKGLDRVSANLIPFTANVTPSLLPLLPDPSVQSMTHVQIPKIQNLPGLINLGSYLMLSQVEETTKGTYTFEVLTHQWEVYASSWLEDVVLPAWPNESISGSKLRWETSLIAAPMGARSQLGPDILNNATHTTHASSDF